MSEFLDVILSFPSVVFTVALAVSVGYWVLALVTGVDANVDNDLEIDGSGLLSFTGLNLVPVSWVFTMISFIGWAVTVLVAVVIGDRNGEMATGAGLALLVGALVLGVITSGRLARRFAPVFTTTPSARHQDLIGRICIVRTGRVDRSFGQAEVVDRDRSSHLVQVRCLEENNLTAGAKALLVDVEDGAFIVSADVELFD